MTQQRFPDQRPNDLPSITRKVRTLMGGLVQSLYVTVGFKNGLPFEISTNTPKRATYERSHAETICGLVSLALQSGVASQAIAAELRGIIDAGAGRAFGSDEEFDEVGDTLADVIAQILEKINNGEIVKQ